jgi:hypothetical protein
MRISKSFFPYISAKVAQGASLEGRKKIMSAGVGVYSPVRLTK